MAASKASRFSAWVECRRPFAIVVVASCRYTECLVHGPSGALADRINPTTNSNLATCNYSITKEYRTTATGRTERQPTTTPARTYAATALASG